MRAVPSTPRRLLLSVALILTSAAPLPVIAQPSRASGEMIERGHKILQQVRKDLEEYYFDSTYAGVDMKTAYRRARVQLDSARDNNHLFAIIAQYLFELRDSHTKFWPPDRAADIQYGFGLQFVGDTCFVTNVTKGSDAEAQGLERGDALLRLDRFKVERSTWSTLQYLYYRLSPRAALKLFVKSPDAEPREITVKAKITKRPRIIDYNDPTTIARLIDELDTYDRTPQHYYVSLGDSVIIWRMPSFSVPRTGVQEMMDVARKHRAIVLDLRNNGGGLLRTQMSLAGHFFDRRVWAGLQRHRDKTDSMYVEPSNPKDAYRGLLIVLVNSNSASASEITARLMQLEGRAIIVGDRTAGAVVASYFLGHEVGFGRVMDYSVQVSVSDIIMSDGNRLEGIGVVPDHVVLPTAADIAARRDPQLAFALKLAGHLTTPEEAGRLFKSDRDAAERD
jgi:carboxyl-terminal processing protease